MYKDPPHTRVHIKISGLQLAKMGMTYHTHTHKGCSLSYFNLRSESFSKKKNLHNLDFSPCYEFDKIIKENVHSLKP